MFDAIFPVAILLPKTLSQEFLDYWFSVIVFMYACNHVGLQRLGSDRRVPF